MVAAASLHSPPGTGQRARAFPQGLLGRQAPWLAFERHLDQGALSGTAAITVCIT
jgi:hypothetical protein